MIKTLENKINVGNLGYKYGFKPVKIYPLMKKPDTPVIKASSLGGLAVIFGVALIIKLVS